MRKINAELLSSLEREFAFGPGRVSKFIQDFHSEMERGLAGKKSSLEMLPAFVDIPSGKESGESLAVDLGGTNLRILRLALNGSGRIEKLAEKRFVLQEEQIKGRGEALFDFIAECVTNLLSGKSSIGFTFSFPVKQYSADSGKLMYWTKGFSASGVVGKDVIGLLNAALTRKGINIAKVTALANDTVGTLVACAYQQPHCDMGVIFGTGTNACYRERISHIHKWRGKKPRGEYMIVNTEWGNFNKVDTTVYDRRVDAASCNPGEHILEKMISGMYLGEITGAVMADLIKGYRLTGLKTEHMSCVEADHGPRLERINSLLRRLGVADSTLAERRLLQKVCRLVAGRAAVLSAASLAAVISKIDPSLAREHIVAVDGTVYEKYPGFAEGIRAGLEKIFPGKGKRIKIQPTKDGSGIGAAIIAAVSASG